MSWGNAFRSRWWVVSGATLGLTVASSAVGLFTFGVFLKPITREFGWSRGTVASAIVVAQFLAAVGTPIVGKLIDRWGIRKVMFPAVVLYSTATASISQTPASPYAFILLYAIWGVAAAGQGPPPYAKAISVWFEARRGLALGIAISGVGLGTALLPQFVQLMIAHFGWRHAYIGLGMIVFVLAFPAVAVVGRSPDSLSHSGSSVSAPHGQHAGAAGQDIRQAMRNFRFWFMGITAFFVAASMNGSTAHLVPLLTDRGISIQLATSAMTVTGLAMIGGRILGGYLLDRFFAPYVATGSFLLPLGGIILLRSGAGGLMPFVGAMCLGLGVGAEIGILAFLVGRYFGLRSYAQIYGFVMMAFMIGSGVGPLLMGICFDKTRTYNLALVGFGLLLILSSILISRLGPYAYPEITVHQSSAAHAEAP